MSNKQELISQIEKLKSVLANPKTDGSTKKILEGSLKKAESKLEELKKAEKLEKSDAELTSKQEKKVEETKKESKSLVNALKSKIESAKNKITKTTIKAKESKKGGARSVAKAKELAKERRSKQKGLSTSDADIEKDANRGAITYVKRTSKGLRANQYSGKGNKSANKGNIYYEKRDNRIDKQNKRYAKLEDGGMMARGGEIDMKKINESAIFYTDESKWSTKPTIKKFQDEINEYQELKIKLDNKEITPSKIIGTGYKPNIARPLAYKYLEERILVSKKAIEILKERGQTYADGGLLNDVGGGTYSGVDLSELSNIDVSEGYFKKGGNLSKKYKYIPNRMINEVEVERNGKETEIDGANIVDGIYVKKGVRFDRGGMNEMANQYIVYLKSNNASYKDEDGFNGNPPAIYYADSTYEVIDYLKENLPDDVEIVSVEEMQPMETYADGGISRDRMFKSQQKWEQDYQRKSRPKNPRYKMADGGMMGVSGEMEGEWIANTGAGMFEGGGSIPNNYRGRTTEDIWNSLTENQKVHFLVDHADELSLNTKDFVNTANKKWKDLSDEVQIAFKGHTMMGQYADGGVTNVGGTMYNDTDLSGLTNNDVSAGYFLQGGMLNKKVNEKIKNYLQDSSASPMHQWEIKTILSSALTDANFHSEAKKVDSIFPKAEFTESGKYSKSQEEYLTERLEDMGREIARMSEWDGYEIINAIAFYVSMNMGRPLGQKVESLKNSMADGGMMAKGGKTQKFVVDDIVYNKRTKTIGIVRIEDERGETKTDADGNVNTIELEHYNPMKYPHQFDGKVAPSTEKEINSRGLWQPFKKMEKGGETSESDVVNYLKSVSGLRASYITEWANKNNVDLNKVQKAIKSKKLKPIDLSTALSGREGNRYSKDIISKYGKDKMAKGGMTKKNVSFADKVKSIKATLLKRKKVSPKVQKDYGKTYSPKEAEESAKRIAGSMRKKEYYKKKS